MLPSRLPAALASCGLVILVLLPAVPTEAQALRIDELRLLQTGEIGSLLRCARPLVEGYSGTQAPLARAALATHLSGAGHFLLNYDLAGEDAVNAEDIAPANGVPDLVERCAESLEESWTSLIEIAGFKAPELSGLPYTVGFENMTAYGYSIGDSLSPGGTRIVLHHRFDIFPPNDDPDGNILGAIRATAAHELKHAVQFSTSGWIEGNWLEGDAVWAEEFVYDQVNDYYQYLSPISAITQPQTPMDSGGPSFDDMVWSQWLHEFHGLGSLQDLWARREAMPSEDLLDSYGAILQARGSNWSEAFARFMTWNQATGLRATPGFGYDEAAAYPTAPIFAQVSNYPDSRASFMQRFSGLHFRYEEFSDRPGATLEVNFSNPSNVGFAWSAWLDFGLGGRVLYDLPVVGLSASASIPTDLPGLETIAISIVNSDPTGLFKAFQVDAQLSIPEPLTQFDSGPIKMEIESGLGNSTSLSFSNLGESNSVLQWQLIARSPLPASEDTVLAMTKPALLAPGTGSWLGLGEATEVRWSGLTGGNVRLLIWRPGSNGWEEVEASIPNSGSYWWTPAPPAVRDALLRVESMTDSSAQETDGLLLYEMVDWMVPSDKSGILASGQQQSINLLFDSIGLDPWVYEGEIVLRDSVAGIENPLSVEMLVRSAGTSNGSLPAKFTLGAPIPNPFNPRTAVSFEMPRDGRVQWELVDARGRRLWSRQSDWLAAGRHMLHLDGFDDQGASLASGVYRLRGRVGDQWQERALVLLK